MGRGLLIIVSGLMIIYGLTQNVLNERQKTITNQNVTYGVHTKSETIANTMADMAFAQVNKFPEDKMSGSFTERDMIGGKGSVIITFDYPYAPVNPYIEHKIIQATGVFQGDTSRVEVRTQRRPFSKYAYFSMKEDNNIHFAEEDIFNGPVHTNDKFYVYPGESPTFNGMVTSVRGFDNVGNPIFNDGKNLNASKVDFPADAANLGEKAAEDGWRFNEDKIKVEFKENGTADISKYRLTGETEKDCTYRFEDGSCDGEVDVPVYELKSTQNYDLNDADFNGLISASNKMEVIGTVNGNVTVHADQEIEIMGDIRYKDDPRKNPYSDDFLGIVSNGGVKLDKEAQKSEGSIDVDIHASIMAMDNDETDEEESFSVEYPRAGNNVKGGGTIRGYINLLGGLIQNKRGIVGARGVGFRKNYSYDKRFMGQSPRGFPRTNIYDYISWKTLQKTEYFSIPG